MGSLSHAKVGEDVVEDVVGGYFGADDFAEVVEAPSEVFGDEVGGSVVGEGLLCTAEGFECQTKSVIMADVCDDGMVGVEVGREGGFLHQSAPQQVDAVAVGCRDVEEALRRLAMIKIGTARQREVAFVDDLQDDLIFSEVDVGEWLVAFGQKENNLCSFGSLDGALYTHLFQLALCLAYACCVDEAEGDAVYLCGVLDEVARCALYV